MTTTHDDKDFAALYANGKTKAMKRLDEHVADAFEKVSELTAKIPAKFLNP